MRRNLNTGLLAVAYLASCLLPATLNSQEPSQAKWREIPVEEESSLVRDPVVQEMERLFIFTDNRRDIELTESQFADLERIRKEYSRRVKDLNEKHPNGVPLEEFREFYGDLDAWVLVEMRSVLLPHQVKRIEQVTFQRIQDEKGIEGLFATRSFRQHVGISVEQYERLLARAKEEQSKLEEAIEKAREKAFENTLNVLRDEQQEQIRELLKR
jgi:hypothetical protein